MWVLAEWVRFLMGLGLAVLCSGGGVLGLADERVGDVGPARKAVAVLMLLVVALLLLPVEQCSLRAGTCRAVRGAAVAQAAGVERAGQVGAHAVALPALIASSISSSRSCWICFGCPITIRTIASTAN